MRRGLSMPLVMALLMVGLALAGCLGAGTTDDTEGPDATDGGDDPSADAAGDGASEGRGGGASDAASTDADPWDGAERVTLLDFGRSPPGFSADVLCQSGGGPQLERDGGLVHPGAAHVELTVNVELAEMGVQVGYAVGDGAPDWASQDAQGDITWFDPVYQGEATFTVPVGPDGVETSRELWAFYYQVNPGHEAACFTGVETGPWTLVVEAVRG